MLFEAVLHTVFQGQNCYNRWNYFSTGTPASVSRSFALVAAMGFLAEAAGVFQETDSIARQLQVAFSEQVVFADFTVFNVYDPVDFYERPFPLTVNGDRTGETQNPLNSYGFRTNRVNRDIARGTKRFTGVLESDTTSGGILTGGQVAQLQLVADLMSEVLDYQDEGQEVSFTPVVVHKQPYTTPKGRTAYRYYPTLEQQVDGNLAFSVIWQPYAQTRSQVTRQYGRGS